MYLPSRSALSSFCCCYVVLSAIYPISTTCDAENLGGAKDIHLLHDEVILKKSKHNNALKRPHFNDGHKKLNSVAVLASPSAEVQLMEGSVSPEELDALYALYIATNGDEWKWKPVLTNGPEWDFTAAGTSQPVSSSPAPCKEGSVWQGLNCTCPSSTNSRGDDTDDFYGNTSDLYCAVRGLSLSQYGLDGPLPAAIGNLAQLLSLDLSNNALTGPIPSLDSLSQLQDLYLGSNVLTGSIPSLNSLNQLMFLALNSNALTGSIPSLDSLSQLRSLDFYSNSLTGSIPSLNSLSKLLHLHLDSNALTGSIPSLHSPSRLRNLDLDSNALTGSIPSLDSLSHLQQLDLDSNALTGSIPSLDSLSQLEELYLNSNALTGSIPSLDSLSQLQDLYLNSNALTGSIPSLDSLSHLQDLVLYSNALTGFIPSLDRLSQLEELYLYSNALTGSIPSLDSLSHLQYLDLYTNALTGSIPSLNSLGKLQHLDLSSNALTNSIPSLDSLSQLLYLYLYSNALTGSIPSLNSPSQLLNFALCDNALTGSIPSLDSLNQLLHLALFSNALTGSIPSLDSLNQLRVLSLFSNALTGSIPSLDSLSKLQELYLYNNALTGCIPSLNSASKLLYLYLYSNALTGSIPSMKSARLLKTVLVQDNRLTGQLVGIFEPSYQKRISTIQLSTNQLTGSIPAQIFELPSLRTFAIVSNCIRGPLPISTICNSSSLRSLLLDGLHTASSCRAPLFGDLSPRLYVLHSQSAGLSNQLDPCLFSIPTLHTLHMSGNGLTGSIPDMMSSQLQLEYSKINIVDLVLSYNDLTGTIPLSLQKQQQWSTLDLSYNRLNGVLSSEFTSGFEEKSESSVRLSLNRISGLIPPSLSKAENITVLTGNLFSCYIDGSNLPVHDKERSNYSCGSSTYNVPYYVWLAIVGFVCIFSLIALCVLHKKKAALISSDENHAASQIAIFHTTSTVISLLKSVISVPDALILVEELVNDDKNPFTQSKKVNHAFHRSLYLNIRRLEELFSGIRRFAGRCWMYILLILAPLYIICGLFNSTYTYRYAWTVSTSFLTGPVTAGLLFCALVVYICFLAIQYRMLLLPVSTTPVASVVAAATADSDAKEISSTVETIISVLPWLAIISINALIVGLSNAGFVWVAVYHGSQLNLFAVQVALAVVKYVWNSKMLRLTIHWFASLVSDLSVAVVSERVLAVELYLAVFNNVIVPCFVVAVVDPDCYYTFLVPPKKVTATYGYTGFECHDILCRPSLLTSTTSFDPPFSYSYQCSASFTTHYATAFLYLCIFTGMVVPLWEFFLIYLYQYSTQLEDQPLAGRPSSSLMQHSSSSKDDSTTTTTIMQGTGTLSPLAISGVNLEDSKKLEVATDTPPPPPPTLNIIISGYSKSRNNWMCKILGSPLVPGLLKPLPLDNTNDDNSSSGGSSKTNRDPNNQAPIFNTAQHLTTVLILLALLLTFGTVFPPLGFAIVVTLVVYTYFTQFKLARFIKLSARAGLTSQVEQVEKECSSFVLPSEQGVWMLASIACWFYAFILFDTLGDTVGLEGAFWILSAMALLPLVLYIGDRLLLRWYARHDTRHSPQLGDERENSGVTESVNDESGGLEMRRMTL